jgi:general secretion pathway protein D
MSHYSRLRTVLFGTADDSKDALPFMRPRLQQMVYSPERNSLAGDAPTGSVLPVSFIGAGVFSGRRHTLHGVKDANGSNMVGGYKSIGKLSAFFFKATPFAFALAVLAISGSVAQAQSAKTFYKRGQAAELRQDYDAALNDYQQAQTKQPGDIRYKTDYARMRFQAATMHVDRGRVLRQSGDPNGALAEFRRAVEIDPSNQAAQQELDRILKESAPPSANEPAPPPPQASEEAETLKQIAAVAGPVTLKPVSNDPITLHMVEDVKVIYQAIGKAAGLNVLFDPDYTSKRIPVDLTNVTLSDALRIVGTISGTFYKPVTKNTIFVAQNTRTKRTELDEEAVQTFYLTNASKQNDGNEIVTAIRNLLPPDVKIYLVPSQDAIVMRATPDQLLVAQKLLNDLDRTRPEVVVDVAILEVNRDKVRNLGITLPQSITLTPQASPYAAASTNSGTSGGTATTTPSTFTLNSLAHINATNFAVGITGGTLNALLTDSDTHILQNPRIRATDGEKASLKIGEKIPIATGSYNAGVSTGVASIGVQTQFTYIDVGVNVDMTPTVHYDNEVSLKMHVEVSSEVNTVTISGVTEPIIGQNIAEQTIQLKDGEPSILAGLITKQNNLNITGTPGLGELPFFKFFFSSQSKEVQDEEIVFILIPHIVRESLLTRLNTRAIDTGTGQSIELRENPASMEQSDLTPTPSVKPAADQTTTAANAAAAMVQQLRQQAQPLTPPPAIEAPEPQQNVQPIQPRPPVNGTGVSLSVVPASSSQAVGSTFQVAVMLNNGHDVFSVPLQLQFNPAVLQLVNVDSGDFLGRDGQAIALAHRDEGNGLVTISSSRPPNTAGVNGQGSVCTLTFKAIAPGESSLALVKVGALNSAQANIPAVGSQAVVHVK